MQPWPSHRGDPRASSPAGRPEKITLEMLKKQFRAERAEMICVRIVDSFGAEGPAGVGIAEYVQWIDQFDVWKCSRNLPQNRDSFVPSLLNHGPLGSTGLAR